MERAQRLYDCITQVSDQYLQEAEDFKTRQGKILHINWKQWGSIAAALVVVAGVGLAMRQMSGGSADSSAPAASVPAMSEPACSAPEASAPQTEDVSPMVPSVEEPVGDAAGDMLRGGGVIRLSEEEHYVILTRDEAELLGLPEDLEQAIAGEAVCWLAWEEGGFVPAQENTGIVLYPCQPELFIVSDGEQYLAAAFIQGR